MAEFLKMNPENLVTRYYGEIGVENGERAVKLDRNRTTPCQFLGEDKSCQVYPVRPDGCKAYPIQTDFGRFGINCPAMKILDAMDYPEEEEENQPLDHNQA
jgi:Fe-S-cluster containining protein